MYKLPLNHNLDIRNIIKTLLYVSSIHVSQIMIQTMIFQMNVSNIIWVEKTPSLLIEPINYGDVPLTNVDKNNGDGFEIFMSDLVNTVIDIQKLSSTSGSPLRSKGIPG